MKLKRINMEELLLIYASSKAVIFEISTFFFVKDNDAIKIIYNK